MQLFFFAEVEPIAVGALGGEVLANIEELVRHVCLLAILVVDALLVTEYLLGVSPRSV